MSLQETYTFLGWSFCR